MRTGREREYLRVGVAAAALVLITAGRYFYLRSLPGGGTFIKYLWFADEILAGRLPHGRIADLSPAYLWLITALRSVDVSLWTIRGLQVGLVSGVAFFVGTVARRIGGWPAAVVAAVLVLGNRAALVNASDFEPETVLLFFEAAAVAAILALPHPSWLHGAAGGLAGGLAIVTRPVALLLVLALAGVVMARSRRAAAAFLAAAAIPVLIILAVNLRLSGEATIMDPGTVFFEGMSARASGCLGEMPQIVNDLQGTLPGPDTLHVAYRLVASRAMGRDVSRGESNRWWAAYAGEYIRTDPLGAVSLTLRKAQYAVQAYDSWDVASMSALQRMMNSPFWIPWPVGIGLAVAGALLGERRSVLPLLLMLAAVAAPMLLFFVTGRHRNPLLVPVALLGGMAVSKLADQLRSGRWRRAAAAAAAGTLVAVLGFVETPCARADDYVATAGVEMRSYLRAAAEARNAGDPTSSTMLQARASVIMPGSAEVPPQALFRAAMAELAAVDDPQRLFRIAIALDNAGAEAEALRLFEAVHKVEPVPTRSLPPPAWYLSRLHAERNERKEAMAWLSQARRTAPYHPDVLASSMVLSADQRAGELLFRLYDPFTATLARNEAASLACRDDLCRTSLERELVLLDERLPEWRRPAMTLAARGAGE